MGFPLPSLNLLIAGCHSNNFMVRDTNARKMSRAQMQDAGGRLRHCSSLTTVDANTYLGTRQGEGRSPNGGKIDPSWLFGEMTRKCGKTKLKTLAKETGSTWV